MLEPKSQIGFEQAGLGSVLKHNQLFVPPNQREYSWEERQVEQLFQDFARTLHSGDYFLGTIVTIPRVGGTLEVVDGQQRLATTAILLAAIRDYLQDIGESVLVESINNEFLTGIDRAQRARVPRLRLNIDDNELFARIISERIDLTSLNLTHNSHTRLIESWKPARSYVRKLVSAHDIKEHGNVLEEWLSFIEHRALAVLLRVPDDADAYKMFETLNDRGLRTSQADLIKNYLFGRSADRIAEVQSRWAHMRGALETLEDEDITVSFLRHALIVLRGFLREADVYDSVQDIAKSPQQAVTFCSSLEELAYSYVASFHSENERWNAYPDAARKSIEVFNLLNIRPMRPLILAITSRMDQKNASESLQFMLSLGVRMLIASGTRTGAIEAPISEAAHDVYMQKILDVTALRSKLTGIVPTDTEFKAAVSAARVSNAKLARYYLRSLELAASSEAEPWFVPTEDRSVINLEHILPKKPEGNWPSFSDDEVRIHANKLGNLALLQASGNSELKSSSFEEKRRVYAQSPYKLTAELAELNSWTPAEIADRQSRLADLAVRAWPVAAR